MRVTREYRGILTFYGWLLPWTLTDEKGTVVNLREEFWKAAEHLKGHSAKLETRRDFCRVGPEEDSEYFLDYNERGFGILVTKREGFGFSSVHSYLSAVMAALNSRRVIVSVEPAGFEIRADPDCSNVPALEIDPGTGNLCQIPEEIFVKHCKIGKDACIFVLAGGHGFQCAKFSGSMAESLLGRKYEGSINAGRIGNCRRKGVSGHIKEDSK